MQQNNNAQYAGKPKSSGSAGSSAQGIMNVRRSHALSALGGAGLQSDHILDQIPQQHYNQMFPNRNINVNANGVGNGIIYNQINNGTSELYRGYKQLVPQN